MRKHIAASCAASEPRSSAPIRQQSGLGSISVDMTDRTSVAIPALRIDVALLTGCQDRPYAFGLATALASHGVCVNVVGGDELDSSQLHASPKLRFVNFRRTRR